MAALKWNKMSHEELQKRFNQPPILSQRSIEPVTGFLPTGFLTTLQESQTRSQWCLVTGRKLSQCIAGRRWEAAALRLKWSLGESNGYVSFRRNLADIFLWRNQLFQQGIVTVRFEWVLGQGVLLVGCACLCKVIEFIYDEWQLCRRGCGCGCGCGCLWLWLWLLSLLLLLLLLLWCWCFVFISYALLAWTPGIWPLRSTYHPSRRLFVAALLTL